MQQQIAIIDCGTNTFTLSIGTASSPQQLDMTLKGRHFVELAVGGINTISPAAFERGLRAFEDFANILKTYPTAKVIALGTAALRNATNAREFVDAAKALSGIDIQIIDGNREAQLIFQGVQLAAPLSTKPSLIIDIGGGSVEFIIANQEQVFWAKSYPIGGAVLYQKFHRSNPITSKDITAIQEHLQQELGDLIEALQNYSIEYLIGASGTFDALDHLLNAPKTGMPFRLIDFNEFDNIYYQLVPLSLEERLEVPNLVPTRAKLIVMSLLIIQFVEQAIGQQPLISSNHALREGLVRELLVMNT